ncbi:MULTISPECIES: HEAT repeat domain-containing protein [unclassified Microcoleus]
MTGKNRRCRAPTLVKAFKDTSPEVRSSVIQALGQLILNEA